jgi:hypothetical protein
LFFLFAAVARRDGELEGKKASKQMKWMESVSRASDF